MTEYHAALDLGTNTWNLVVASYTDDQLHIHTREHIPVLLFADGDPSELSKAAQERAEKALEQFQTQLKAYGLSLADAPAFATSALRTTSNGEAFAETLRERHGIQLELIDGQREAGLIYQGVRASGLLAEDPALIMDIGGGSVEFVLGNASRTWWSGSFRIGVSRLFAEFSPSDPMTELDQRNLDFYLEQQLLPLLEALASYPPSVFIGTSGSFESFAAMIAASAKRDKRSEQPENPYTLPREELLNLCTSLLETTHEERLQREGLVEHRAETIQLSALLVLNVLRLAPVTTLFWSPFALKEGVIFEALQHSSHG